MLRRRALALVLLTLLPLAPALAQSAGPTWDFETGTLDGWTATGGAFYRQPTLDDNVAARDPSIFSNHEGYYWVGTYEDRWNPNQEPGLSRGLGPTGQLLSDPFVLQHDRISFLVAGSPEETTTYVGLRVNGVLVARAIGDGSHMLARYAWDVSEWLDQEARIIVVDNSAGGFVSVDDFRFYDVGGAGDDDAPLTDGGLAAPGAGTEGGASDDASEATPPEDEKPSGAPDAEPEEEASPVEGKPAADEPGAPAQEPSTPDLAEPPAAPRRCEGVDDVCKTPIASTDPSTTTPAACEGKACARAEPLAPPPADEAYVAPLALPVIVDAPVPPPSLFARVMGAIGNFFSGIFRGIGAIFGRAPPPDAFAARDLASSATDVSVAASGNDVHVAYVTSEDGSLRVRVATSHDRGATFPDDVAVSSGARPASNVTIGATPEAGIVVAWLERDANGRTYVAHAQSRDGGRVFSSPNWRGSGQVATFELAMAGRHAHLVWREGTAGAGALHHVDAAEAGGFSREVAARTVGRYSVGGAGERATIAYGHLYQGTDPDITHIQSNDGGRTWSPATLIIGDHGPQWNAAVAVTSGRSYLISEEAQPVAPSLGLNHHRAVELQWWTNWAGDDVMEGRGHMVVTRYCACNPTMQQRSLQEHAPLVAATASGGVHVAYLNTTSASGRDIIVTTLSADGRATPLSSPVSATQLGVIDLADAGGKRVLAYEDTGSREVMVAPAGLAPINVSASTDPSGAPSVAGVAGRAYVAWLEGPSGERSVRFRAVEVPA